MKIGFNPQINQQTKNTNFKSNITFDIGGSQREGSCKIYYASTPKDEEFYREHTTVNTLGKRMFADSDDFINNIVNKIVKIQKDNKKIVEEKGYDESENSLKNVTIFLPSYTMGNKAFYLPNIRNRDDKPLKDLDFSDFKERLINAGADISDDLQFKICQDALGAGLAMAQKLYHAGMLKEGSLYTACVTGGGCAVATIEAVDTDNVIIKSSGSGYLSQSLDLQKVSRAGASAPALIENFCKAMGFNEEVTADVKACHKAEFVLSKYATYNKKDPKAKALKDILLHIDAYEIDSEDENEFTIKVKDEYKTRYNIARRNAIDKYALALARLAIIKKNEGSNGMLITGMLAKAVNKAAKNSYDLSLSEWVMQHLTQSFNSYELDKLQEIYDFNVYCEDKFFIDNNTECGQLAHLAKFVGPFRKNWLRISIDNLKKEIAPTIKKLK